MPAAAFFFGGGRSIMALDDAIEGQSGGMFQRFFHSQVSGSIVLMVSTAVALIWANSPWSDRYFDLAHTYIGVSWGDATFKMSLSHWIMDGLMAIFFFVVGLEVKREILVGELSTMRKAVLPVSAALGGAVVPAVIYASLNAGSPGSPGWGVPMATDIAFALGILAMLGSRVPIGLKVFLTALAIADDLIAVVVIALFYTEQINVAGLICTAVFIGLIVVANRLGNRQMWIYVLLATGAWFGVLLSGVHATIAGVLIAIVVPVRATIRPSEFLGKCRKSMEHLERGELTRESMISNKDQLRALNRIHTAADDMIPSGLRFEKQLHPVQSFMILPLFALFSAGVKFDAETLADATGTIGWGIILGLVLGKQIGVTAASWLAIRSGRADMPEGVNWSQLWGVSCLSGVGFTMSIFIAGLAFTEDNLVSEAKIGILVASLISGVVGYLVLRRALPPRAE
jgi:NhaA family Na+:H+ antiporter